MASSIPTEADWRSEPWWIDTPHAYEHFAGKSLAEAVGLFKNNAIYYQEDVMWMPSACFPFYAGAYIQYLLSDDSKGDSDGANCLFGLVEFRSPEIRANPPLLPWSLKPCAILRQGRPGTTLMYPYTETLPSSPVRHLRTSIVDRGRGL